MANLTGFNANTVEPMTEYKPIPAGQYVAVIANSETKPTKAGNGSYLELSFQIIDGEFKNRLVWTRLNLENPNPLTVKIARSELSAICRAVGVLEPKDSCELHNLPLVITVKQKTDRDGEVRNKITNYAKREAADGRPQQASTATANGNAYAGTTPPWRRA